jgi:hypothetical protein
MKALMRPWRIAELTVIKSRSVRPVRRKLADAGVFFSHFQRQDRHGLIIALDRTVPDLADRGRHAGPQYRDLAALFEQAHERIKPGGSIYVMLSSDSDLDLLGRPINTAGLLPRWSGASRSPLDGGILEESARLCRFRRFRSNPLGRDSGTNGCC